MASNKSTRSFFWNNSRLLEPKDVAARMNLSLKTVQKLAREGKLACVLRSPPVKEGSPGNEFSYLCFPSLH